MTRRLRRMLWATLAVVTVLVVLAIGVFPTRQYLDQRAQATELRARLQELRGEKAHLETAIAELDSAFEIERLARMAPHGYVRPGEEAYRVIVPGGTPDEVPSLWPF